MHAEKLIAVELGIQGLVDAALLIQDREILDLLLDRDLLAWHRL